MSSCPDATRRRRPAWRAAALALACAAGAAWLPVSAWAAPRYDGVGRSATEAEIQAWDIDVRPDFRGLPAGQGSVRRGEQIWEAQCASCHGSFGESNDVFTPLVGHTTRQDMVTGRVASLLPGANAPGRTTVMKLSQLATLWDYIRRAMPWTAPKTLSVDEVYAVTAYMLNLADIVPADFTLSDRNIREVQARLPNRNGMTTDHALWPGRELGGHGRPDVQGTRCMRDCPTETRVASLIPDHARTAHGNLADQVRGIGPTRGMDTRDAAAAAAQAASSGVAPAPSAARIQPLLQKNVCVACHGMDSKLVGPSFKEIAARYQGRTQAEAYLLGRIRGGSQGVWGPVPMPAQSIGDDEARQVARWLAEGAAP